MMKKQSNKIEYYYEKFRAFLLVFLMMLCIIQVGILWSSQSGSFPFSIFKGSKAAQVSIEESKSSYLLPYQIVLSTGYDEDHYIITNGTKEYNDLWNGAKAVLARTLDTKPKQSQTFTEEKWAKLAANKPFFFEFKTRIPIEIIRWVLNLSDSAVGDLSSIYKFLICPDDPENGYADTLYIRDGMSNIYTYTISDFKDNELTPEKIQSIYEKHSNDGNARNYKMAIEINDTRYPQDMLGPMISSQTPDSYPDISCRPLAETGDQSSLLEEYDIIAQELFGKSKNDFVPDEDVYGSLLFKKLDSFYKVYKNSILEYKYTENQNISEKVKLLDAYKNALSFIITHKTQSKLLDNVNIYLNTIIPGNNSYIFNFDIAISGEGSAGELPIYVKDYSIPNTDETLKNAITIEANAKRVTNCKWLILNYTIDKDVKKYRWSFVDMFDKVYNKYPALKDEEDAYKGYGIYYVVSNSGQRQYTMTPEFILFGQRENYDVPLDLEEKK